MYEQSRVLLIDLNTTSEQIKQTIFILLLYNNAHKGLVHRA